MDSKNSPTPNLNSYAPTTSLKADHLVTSTVHNVFTSAPKPNGSTSQTRFKTETVKGDSRIEYVPFEKKVVDYADEKRYSLIPKKKVITDYREQVRV